jgi:23S rRNA (pseudouridine1915-N3)-methyltransferase
MRVTLVAVGKMKASPAKEMMQDYLKRLPWQVEIKEVEAKKGLSGDALQKQEGELLLAAVPKGAKKIVLDERGKVMGSIDFSKKLKSFEMDSGHVAFVIGGADGHAKAVKQSADMLLSFGAMAWPHMMVRAMLAEQLYRAYAISTGHPYHRE